MPVVRRRRPGPLLASLSAAVAIATGICGCASTVASPTPGDTTVPIGPAPWPSGTVGQYGLRIDPSLLARLPIAVDGIPIVEDTLAESAALDDQSLSGELDRYAAARAGIAGDADWVSVEIVEFKPAFQNGDAYSQWIDDYAAQACSQAEGLAGSSQADIGHWSVNVDTCNGGVTAYSLSLGNGRYMSMFGLGPRDLGRKLISNLN